MGLDCIPQEYPCVLQGTVVLTAEHPQDKKVIDCKATQAAGGCPWKRAMEEQDRGSPVYGMLGTDCWYRGKVGTWMLNRLEEAGYEPPEGGFYGAALFGGEELDGLPDLAPGHCKELSDWMAEHAEAYAALLKKDPEISDAEIPAELDAYRYAAWWVGWVGEAAGGARAWY